MINETEFLTAYKVIKKKHETALQEMKSAVAFDEQGDKPLQAIAAYEKCLQQIDDIFSIQVGLPDNVDNVSTEWSDACTIIQQLKVTRNRVRDRLKVLEEQFGDELGAARFSNNGFVAPKSITTYDVSVSGSNALKAYKQIIQDIRQKMETNNGKVWFNVLFYSQVTLYKIEANGVVKTVSGETSMTLDFCTVRDDDGNFKNLYVIKCSMGVQSQAHVAGAGEEYEVIWIYPLLRSVTTCYVTDFNAFIFPDLEAETPGAAFGLLLRPPPQLSEEAAKDFRQCFSDLLNAVLAGHVAEIPEKYEYVVQGPCGDVVSHRIVAGANCVARNLIRGAEKAGELLVKNTPYIIAKIQPAEDNAVTISPTVQTTVKVAKGVTGAAVGITTWVAGKVGSASMALGRYLAPHIQYYGANLLQKTCGLDNEEANTKMEGAITVAAGAVEGFSTIVNGLEKSAAILGTNISENSVKIIEHKYGSSAGSLAAGTFDTLGSAFVVSRNVNYMLPKGIAKSLVKNTGKAVVTEYKHCRAPQYITAGHLYPDLRGLKQSVIENEI